MDPLISTLCLGPSHLPVPLNNPPPLACEPIHLQESYPCPQDLEPFLGYGAKGQSPREIH